MREDRPTLSQSTPHEWIRSWHPSKGATLERHRKWIAQSSSSPLSSLELPWAQPSQTNHTCRDTRTNASRRLRKRRAARHRNPVLPDGPASQKRLDHAGETVFPIYDFSRRRRLTGELLELFQENARLSPNVYFLHKYNIALLEAPVFFVLRFCPGERPITKTIHSPHRPRNSLARQFGAPEGQGHARTCG